MDTDALIDKILKANHPLDVFHRLSYKKEYLQMMKLLHPDVCTHPKATDAVSKLNGLRVRLEEMLVMEDDAGTFEQLNETTIVFSGDKQLLQRSYEQYERLMAFTDAASLHFRKYLPSAMSWKGDQLVVHTAERVVPFMHLSLPQHHVTWITSRMYELMAWFHQVGMCHAGISPASLFVVPKTHGIVCASFYHLVPLDTKLLTVSGKYLSWYPSVVFTEKRAVPYVDISLVQRTALYLLGDESGNGVKLKKTCNEQLIDFLITPHYQSFETFDQYRKMLTKVFGKPVFYPLDI